MDSQIKEKNSLRGKLTSCNYLKVSYAILKKFKDPDVGVFLSFLVSAEMYHEKNKWVDEDGYFLCTRPFVENMIGISTNKQINVTEKLKTQGLISVVKKSGTPSKTWIRLNHSIINTVLDNYVFSDFE